MTKSRDLSFTQLEKICKHHKISDKHKAFCNYQGKVQACNKANCPRIKEREEQQKYRDQEIPLHGRRELMDSFEP